MQPDWALQAPSPAKVMRRQTLPGTVKAPCTLLPRILYYPILVAQRLLRSLTIETSPRNSLSDTESGVKIVHPDGTVSVMDHVPRGSLKVFRYLEDQDKIVKRM